ncbi:Magnetosome protein MamI-3 [Desulfovibrionales bacterium]
MKQKPFNSAKAYQLIAATLAGVLLVLSVVLANGYSKPQSPQAMVAAAINGDLFTPREWKPGMGPQPFIYHPAVARKPVWQPLPETNIPGTARIPAGSGIGTIRLGLPNVQAVWRPLPSTMAQEASIQPATGAQQGIRAYTGPAQ